MRRLTLLSICSSLCVLALPAAARAQAIPPDSADPYVWLEEMTGERAMAWVKAENAKTLAVLEKDARFESMYKDALAMAQAKDRIPYVYFLGGRLYNFWQDSAHVRGLWRRTTLASNRRASPEWATVLDVESLAKAEKADWVWQGATCAQPEERGCLSYLSDAGTNAAQQAHTLSLEFTHFTRQLMDPERKLAP